jgi:hypothetical protein
MGQEAADSRIAGTPLWAQKAAGSRIAGIPL